MNSLNVKMEFHLGDTSEWRSNIDQRKNALHRFLEIFGYNRGTIFELAHGEIYTAGNGDIFSVYRTMYKGKPYFHAICNVGGYQKVQGCILWSVIEEWIWNNFFLVNSK